MVERKSAYNFIPIFVGNVLPGMFHGKPQKSEQVHSRITVKMLDKIAYVF
jgi:hypothetical protein